VSFKKTTLEDHMENVIRVAKRLIPIEQIVLFEPFIAPTDPPLRTEKEFKSRIVLLDRMSILSEESAEELTAAHSFRFVAADRIGTNPAVQFSVEDFEPAENFKPRKPFLSRLSWSDSDGNARSKLMLASPEVLLAAVVRGEVDPGTEASNAAPKPRRRRSPAARRPTAPQQDPA
jgi:hypothetical protein